MVNCGCSPTKTTCPNHAAIKELRFTVAVKHRDLCAGCVDAPNTCASRLTPDAWQTVSAHLYLSEALEYGKTCATAGHITSRVYSFLCDPVKVYEWTPDGKVKDVDTTQEAPTA